MRHCIEKSKAFQPVNSDRERFEISQSSNFLDSRRFREIICTKALHVRQLPQESEVALVRVKSVDSQSDVAAHRKQLLVQQVPRFTLDRLRDLQGFQLAVLHQRFDIAGAERA